MDIGEVAKRTGLPVSALRFYEEKGLIRSIGRNGLRRVFGDDVLERLALIALGQSAGFSLDEIAPMLGTAGAPQIDRSLLAGKAKELDRHIKRLTAVRDGLRHASVCPAPSYLECPSFRRLLQRAAEGSIGGLGETPLRRKRRSKKKARAKVGRT